MVLIMIFATRINTGAREMVARGHRKMRWKMRGMASTTNVAEVVTESQKTHSCSSNVKLVGTAQMSTKPKAMLSAHS